MSTIAVDSILGPASFAAWTEIARALGVHPVTGGKEAARRRYVAVRFPGRRTPTELRRAAQWRKAQRNRNRVASGSQPKTVTLNAPMSQTFGAIGPAREPVGHYTAGPRDTSDSHGLSLLRTYNQQHRAQGWGAIGYHYAILRSGTLVLCRPASWKGAHTAGQNTGRVGIVVLGTTGQRMTAAQRSTLQWLRANAHTTRLPARHRAPAKLRRQTVHRDWNATSCAGDYSLDYKAA